MGEHMRIFSDHDTPMRPALQAVAAALFVLAGLPSAHAGDAQDLATVKACISSEKDGHACIGRLSDTCQKQLKNETTQEMVDCVNREQSAWDTILNERYKTEVDAAKSADDDLKTTEGNWEPVLDDLKKAQRAWVAFRDAECMRRYALYQTGTIRFDMEAACQLDLTAERALGIVASQQ